MSHIKYPDPATTRCRPVVAAGYPAKFVTRPTSICFVMSISQRPYLFKLLRSQEMLKSKFDDDIFVALVVSQITYALSLLNGFLNGQQKTGIYAF